MAKLTSISEAVKTLSTASGISEKRLNRFVLAAATDTVEADFDTTTDSLIGVIYRQGTSYVYVRKVTAARHGLLNIQGACFTYDKSDDGFSMEFNQNYNTYIREANLLGGLSVITEEDFKKAIEGCLIDPVVVLDILTADDKAIETLDETMEETVDTLTEETVDAPTEEAAE